MKSHKDLTVWVKSMELAQEIYSVTRQLPKHELFGMSSQMQRSSVGIPSNIAEGAKRGHRLEFIQFLSIANGSASELETQLLLCQKLYPEVNYDKALLLVDEILKMLHKLILTLKKAVH